MSIQHIDIIVNYDDFETNIRMKKTTRMYNAFAACCDKFGLKYENYILSKGGIQLNEKEDATYNGIMNGDVLDIEKYISSKHKDYS